MTDNLTIQEYLSTPQALIAHMRQTGDLHEGFRFIDFISEVRGRLDSTLDTILPSMEQIYEETQPSEFRGMDFFDVLLQSTSLSPDTISRHLKVGKMLEALPESVRPAIEAMGFKSKIALSKTIEDGYELTEEQLTEVADAYYPQEVALVLHDIKGTTPRSQFCKPETDEDGNLWAYTATGRYKVWEPVHYDDPETEEHAQWAREKMIKKLEARKRRT